MKPIVRLAVVLGALLAATQQAHARRYYAGGEAAPRHFGIGIELGQPTAITAQLLLDYNSALELSLGLDTPDDRDLYFHVTYQVFPVDLLRDQRGDVSLPLYVGIGGFLIDVHPTDSLFVGARVPLGIAINFHTAPVQIFFELSVKVIIIVPRGYDSRRADLDAAVGVRLYF